MHFPREAWAGNCRFTGAVRSLQGMRRDVMKRCLYIVASLVWLTGTLCASIRPSHITTDSLDLRGKQIRKATVRDPELADFPHAVITPACEITQPPQALTTPDPLLGATDSGTKVTVSFIVSTDGTVQSPFILESTGSYEDRSVLEAVKAWRYRPATCNGVPMEAEGRIEFSSR